VAKERSMNFKEELNQFRENAKKEIKHLYEKVKQHPLTCLICIIVIVTAVVLLIALPHWQVSGINNVTEKVTQESQSRATLAQILGGTVVGIGIYFAWGNLTTAREGQITERFTRAIDQLGNDKLEIRLGGIYALERISNESENDFLPIMEILTAYVRKNVPHGIDNPQVPIDIQAILTIIGKPDLKFREELNGLDLQKTSLRKANLEKATLIGVNFNESSLYEANIRNSNLTKATLINTTLINADVQNSNLERANLNGAWLMGAKLLNVNLKAADLSYARLSAEINKETVADLEKANLKGTIFKGAILERAKNLTFDQLSKAKTLYNAKLDPELEGELRARGYSHLSDDEP
jgi:uncharacterized protein YjbI with pentapeptide repeats